MTDKYADAWTEIPPPPAKVRLRWLELIQRLEPDAWVPTELTREERGLQRNIVRWVMGERGARRSLPAGIVIRPRRSKNGHVDSR